MAQMAIREADGKRMIARLLGEYTNGAYSLHDKFISVEPETDLKNLPEKYKWLENEKLVVKPDQLIKRRGKSKLLLLNANWKEAEEWINQRIRKPVTVGSVTGVLDHFIIEPFIPHNQSDEYYLAITSIREGDNVLFYHQGGIDVGDVDTKALKMMVPTGEYPTAEEIGRNLLGQIPTERRRLVSGFIEGMFRFYVDLNYAYLEINPFVAVGDRICLLDLAAKLDDTAEFEMGEKWGSIKFPSPFGRTPTREEAYIEELDSKTGASLKLTILNPQGRIWTMVAGGGASVIYADTITDLGFMHEMANYGEYSGDPNEEFTYLYARTILDLMTRTEDPRGKILLIGGGIANFTDVANTFKGIVRALKEHQQKLVENKVKIYVRRGGPNYEEGLRIMRDLGNELGVPIEVYGPDTHMTRIVSMALGVGRQ
ncbi:MAG: ATP citrate lyase citrate-binding domain-containing protein [archaeon]